MLFILFAYIHCRYLSGNEIGDLTDDVFPEDNVLEILWVHRANCKLCFIEDTPKYYNDSIVQFLQRVLYSPFLDTVSKICLRKK